MSSPAANGLAHGDALIHHQVTGVSQPHIGAVGESGEPEQDVKLVGLGVHQHPPGELCVETRDGHRPGGAQDGVVFKAQHLGGGKDAHGVLVVQRNPLGVHPREILEHADHGGVIVAQNVQLEQVGLHGVVLKMGGDDVAVGIIGGGAAPGRSRRSPGSEG